MDPYAFTTRTPSDPAVRHFAITPSNTVDLPTKPKVLYCAAAGTVALMDDSGTTLTYTLAAGQVFPFSPKRVLATGTTATVVGWL